MKIMVEDKKKQIIYIVIIVLSLGGTAWVWLGGGFFGGSDLVILPPTGFSSRADSQILPFGTKLDTTIFSDPRFKELKDIEPLTVSKEELGRLNPFIAPTTTPQ